MSATLFPSHLARPTASRSDRDAWALTLHARSAHWLRPPFSAMAWKIRSQMSRCGRLLLLSHGGPACIPSA
eukprot:439464-Pyramimonas_sp.AAC.1